MRSRLFILAAALLWSTAGAAIKVSALNAWQISSGRALVAALALWLLLPSARRLPSRGGFAVAVGYAVTVVAFVLATKQTTAANAIFLQSTAPLHVLLFAPLLIGERPSRLDLLSVPLFLVGLGLFFVDKLAPGQLEGNLLALFSGLAFGLTIIGMRLFSSESAPALVTGNLLAGLLTLPLAVQGFSPTPVDVGLLAYLGVFQLALAYALFTRGVRDVPALEAALLALIEPVLNPVWTFLLTGERPGPWALTGGAIILAGTVLRTLQGARGGGPAARRPISLSAE